MICCPVSYTHLAEARCIKGTCAARCANNDVCRAHDLGQVLRAGMADGHAGIAAKQQHGNRFAHHKTATNNNYVLALYRDIVKIERPYACLLYTSQTIFTRIICDFLDNLIGRRAIG